MICEKIIWLSWNARVRFGWEVKKKRQLWTTIFLPRHKCIGQRLSTIAEWFQASLKLDWHCGHWVRMVNGRVVSRLGSCLGRVFPGSIPATANSSILRRCWPNLLGVSELQKGRLNEGAMIKWALAILPGLFLGLAGKNVSWLAWAEAQRSFYGL